MKLGKKIIFTNLKMTIQGTMVRSKVCILLVLLRGVISINISISHISIINQSYQTSSINDNVIMSLSIKKKIYVYWHKCILVTLWQQGLSGWCVVGSCGDILLAVILHWTHITYRRTPAVVYFGVRH